MENQADIAKGWPSSLQNYLRETYGAITAVEPLSGKSLAQVWRARFGERSVIVKASAKADEYTFYLTIAPFLKRHSIPLPELEWTGQAGEFYWFVLEDIPEPLPRERWHADPDMLGVLKRLHSIPVAEDTPPPLYRPAWTPEMNRKALQCCPGADRPYLQTILSRLMEENKPLFNPSVPISGDPNATNWGLRRDGSIVLFDWERFGYGTPALDLGISVPGLGDTAIYNKVAATYLELNPETPAAPVTQLAREIAIAKIWVVVEFLGFSVDGTLGNTEGVTQLGQSLVPWVGQIVS